VSVEEPGVCGMTRRIGLLGKSLALCAALAAMTGSKQAAASTIDAGPARFMAFLLGGIAGSAAPIVYIV
jgi:hypothetical protein